MCGAFTLGQLFEFMALPAKMGIHYMIADWHLFWSADANPADIVVGSAEWINYVKSLNVGY